MNKVTSFLSRPIVIILLVLFLDQAFKVWVKTHMYIGEEFNVLGDWFRIHFTENNGMAFGLEFGSDYGKLFLSLFRILAVFGIGYYLYKLTKEDTPKGVLVSIALIFAGAVGNIIDSVFYGMIFNESYQEVAEFLPADGGYAPILYGKVVDMLYFPLVEGYIPDWFPFWKGDHFIFFRPVFNLADSAITIGVAIMILFHRDFFRNVAPGEHKAESNEAEASTSKETIAEPGS